MGRTVKYDYPAIWDGPSSVLDGDTVRLTVTMSVDIGFHVVADFSARQKFRLAGVNCPELSQKPQGEDARQFTIDWLTQHADHLHVTSLRADKFGDRWDGIVRAEIDGVAVSNLSDELLAAGHAVPYPKVKL